MKQFNIDSINVTWDELYGYYGRAVRKIIMPWDIVCLHGGGNMGDTWFNEEQYRRKFIEQNRRRRMIIFPQTIDYSETEKGKKQQEESKFYYNHSNITIIAREKVSYKIMKELYPKANIILTPDIVLSLPAQRFDLARDGALLCMRRDKEKMLLQENEKLLKESLQKEGLTVTFTDTVINQNIVRENRKQLVEDKLRELASARIVVTDRLHGMVFCALTGTPCIVLSNNNHKVKGTYDWISYLPYIKYANTVEEAVTYIPDMLDIKKCFYDNTPLQPHFETLKHAVKKISKCSI